KGSSAKGSVSDRSPKSAPDTCTAGGAAALLVPAAVTVTGAAVEVIAALADAETRRAVPFDSAVAVPLAGGSGLVSALASGASAAVPSAVLAAAADADA